MQCERLLQLTKSWYLSVKDETMAPARMIAFIEQHAESCNICRDDPNLKQEIAKITEIVLPESKIPKAVRQQEDEDVAETDEEETGNDEDENEDEDLDDEI